MSGGAGHDEAAARLDAGLTALGLEPARLRAPLLAYLRLLGHWNRRVDLVAPATPAEWVTRHLLDSLVVSPFVDAGPVVDIGSGAGLPGLVLAVARPELEWRLLEPRARRAAFLRHAVTELGLGNCAVVTGRAEQWSGPPVPVAVSRAVAPIARLWPLARGLLAPGGRLLAMVGRVPAGLPSASAVHRLTVPGLDARRHLVVLSAGGRPLQ